MLTQHPGPPRFSAAEHSPGSPVLPPKLESQDSQPNPGAPWTVLLPPAPTPMPPPGEGERKRPRSPSLAEGELEDSEGARPTPPGPVRRIRPPKRTPSHGAVPPCLSSLHFRFYPFAAPKMWGRTNPGAAGIATSLRPIMFIMPLQAGIATSESLRPMYIMPLQPRKPACRH